jgi:hypothetical protein
VLGHWWYPCLERCEIDLFLLLANKKIGLI